MIPRLILIACALTARLDGQTNSEATSSALEVLGQQGPNLSSWVLAPLDQSIPHAIRQNVTRLREDLLDEGKARPAASLDAYRTAYQMCGSIISALDERDKMLSDAGFRAVQAGTVSPATNQALEARRNYMMSWPQYQREVQQRNELQRVGEAGDRRRVELAVQELKQAWVRRTEVLRSDLDVLYAKFRAGLRRDGAVARTLDGAKPDPSVAPRSAAMGSTLLSDPVGFTNSLSMKFVAVPGTSVLMCIHETRNRDYAAYAAAQKDVDGSWQDKAGSGKADHPVIIDRYEEAAGFCRWLSAKEGKSYRPPTDEEWSAAAGQTRFPWGSQFPPDSTDGNYSVANDGFAGTAPVMSYPANPLGIHDLGGNAWEWCDTWYVADLNDAEIRQAIPRLAKEVAPNTYRVLRGASWQHGDDIRLRSLYRDYDTPVRRNLDRGFRCVMVSGG